MFLLGGKVDHWHLVTDRHILNLYEYMNHVLTNNQSSKYGLHPWMFNEGLLYCFIWLIILVWDTSDFKSHSRSNRCSSSFSVMSSCRADCTDGIVDSWPFRFITSSLRKRDLQEADTFQSILVAHRSFHWFIWVHSKLNSPLDSWTDVLAAVAAAACCFVALLHLTPGVSA